MSDLTQAEYQEILRTLDLLELDQSPATFAQNISAQDAEPWLPYRHLMLLNQKLLDIAEGRINRLYVAMPYRHGKSMMCSTYFPAWFLNKYPDKRVIIASYGDDFAMGWGRKVRDLIENNEHKLKIRVSKGSSAADRWDLDGHKGGMKTAGVGGQLTGLGAHLFIIDDPTKDMAEANSAVIRDQKWDWWRTVAHSRLEPGGAVVIVSTRWHEDDLPGRILKEEGDRWEVLNLPALAESEDDALHRKPGEALCPERYDEKALAAIRETIGNQAFSAGYQQRPQPEGGGAFKRADFRYWRQQEGEGFTYILESKEEGAILVPQAECWRFITMDLALTKRTTSDYTTAAIWDVAPWLEPSALILRHLERTRIEGAEHVDLAVKLWKQWKPSFIGIEEAMQGSMTMAFARRQGVVVRGLKHKSKDKPFRAKDAELLMENHRIYFPKKAPWLPDFEHELLLFPSGTHDDQVDVLAYAAKELLAGINMHRRPKPPEPDTIDAKVWATLQGRNRSDHPVLGAGYS